MLKRPAVPSGLMDLPLEEQLAAVSMSGKSLASWAVVLYSALGPGALATYLQTKGQATVPATQAQVGRLLENYKA